jgi:hypothetical protein
MDSHSAIVNFFFKFHVIFLFEPFFVNMFRNWPWYFVFIFSMFPSSVDKKHQVFGLVLDSAKLMTQ